MKLRNIGGVCCCFLLLAGCSSEITPELRVKTASIFAEPEANQNSAVAVDLVLVYDNDLLGAISKMPAKAYFEAANQLRLDNPSLLDVWRWELVPGQVVKNFSVSSDKGRAFGGLVFANYLTPGDHRVKIPPSGEVRILLKKDDVMSVAAGSFDGMNVGKTASEDVPAPSAGASTKAKMPCDHPLAADPDPHSAIQQEPGGFVILQHQTIDVNPLDDGVGKDRGDLPRPPVTESPPCAASH